MYPTPASSSLSINGAELAIIIVSVLPYNCQIKLKKNNNKIKKQKKQKKIPYQAWHELLAVPDLWDETHYIWFPFFPLVFYLFIYFFIGFIHLADWSINIRELLRQKGRDRGREDCSSSKNVLDAAEVKLSGVNVLFRNVDRVLWVQTQQRRLQQ